MPIRSISDPFVGSARQCSVAERIATRLYRSTRQLQEDRGFDHQPAHTDAGVDAPNKSGNTPQPVSLVCISDTHNTFPTPLPMGDILVHAGDLSQYGTFAEIQAQLKWIASQPHPFKIVISGNHDLLLDSKFVAAHPDRELGREPGQRRSDLDWDGIYYLEHASVEIFIQEKDRRIRVYGSPWTPKYGSFAFQYANNANDNATEAFTWADSVPVGTDLVIVHGPPKGHLDDAGKGCENLLAELWRAKPKIAVCGHIHAGRGEERLLYDRSQASFERAGLGRQPWISVLMLTLCFVWYKLRNILGFSSSHYQNMSTHLINAAMLGGRGNSEQRDAIVLDI